ncbi:MAG: heavy-metal-associated domain-containing protein [Steroidobacteraceae bacterium]|uniref:Heavy metal transport/detoxification protein n=1 Tax=mine drainage metagenome TaxID=410659 RepID=T1ALX5_9ZZZZ
MKYVKLRLEGMHCDACARNLEITLQSEPGVRAATVEFETSEARILYNPQVVTENLLIEATARLGFRVVARER